MTSPRGAAPARVTHNGIDARAESRPRRAARLRKRRKVASTNSSQSRGLAISACDHSETHATDSVFNASGKGRVRQAARGVTRGRGGHGKGWWKKPRQHAGAEDGGPCGGQLGPAAEEERSGDGKCSWGGGQESTT